MIRILAAQSLFTFPLERCLESKISCPPVSEIPGPGNFLEMLLNMSNNDMHLVVRAIILIYIYIYG
jgi:hypothetical protein